MEIHSFVLKWVLLTPYGPWDVWPTFWRNKFFLLGPSWCRPGWNRLKWPIIRPILGEISKFLFSIKTILNYEFFFLKFFFSCRAPSQGRPGWNKLKWPIIRLFLDEISKFLLPMKTILNYEFFFKYFFSVMLLAWAAWV